MYLAVVPLRVTRMGRSRMVLPRRIGTAGILSRCTRPLAQAGIGGGGNPLRQNLRFCHLPQRGRQGDGCRHQIGDGDAARQRLASLPCISSACQIKDLERQLSGVPSETRSTLFRLAQGDADGTESNGSATADRHRWGSCRVARDRVPLGRAAGVNPRPTYTPQMNIETIVARCRERPVCRSIGKKT